jgi:hypothetical protein
VYLCTSGWYRDMKGVKARGCTSEECTLQAKINRYDCYEKLSTKLLRNDGVNLAQDAQACSTTYAAESTEYWDLRSDQSQAVSAVKTFTSCGAQFAIRGGGHMNVRHFLCMIFKVFLT